MMAPNAAICLGRSFVEIAFTLESSIPTWKVCRAGDVSWQSFALISKRLKSRGPVVSYKLHAVFARSNDEVERLFRLFQKAYIVTRYIVSARNALFSSIGFNYI